MQGMQNAFVKTAAFRCDDCWTQEPVWVMSPSIPRSITCQSPHLKTSILREWRCGRTQYRLIGRTLCAPLFLGSPAYIVRCLICCGYLAARVLPRRTTPFTKTATPQQPCYFRQAGSRSAAVRADYKAIGRPSSGCRSSGSFGPRDKHPWSLPLLLPT
jgi:hypothetical protein